MTSRTNPSNKRHQTGREGGGGWGSANGLGLSENKARQTKEKSQICRKRGQKKKYSRGGTLIEKGRGSGLVLLRVFDSKMNTVRVIVMNIC